MCESSTGSRKRCPGSPAVLRRQARVRSEQDGWQDHYRHTPVSLPTGVRFQSADSIAAAVLRGHALLLDRSKSRRATWRSRCGTRPAGSAHAPEQHARRRLPAALRRTVPAAAGALVHCRPSAGSARVATVRCAHGERKAKAAPCRGAGDSGARLATARPDSSSKPSSRAGSAACSALAIVAKPDGRLASASAIGCAPMTTWRKYCAAVTDPKMLESPLLTLRQTAAAAAALRHGGYNAPGTVACGRYCRRGGARRSRPGAWCVRGGGGKAARACVMQAAIRLGLRAVAAGVPSGATVAGGVKSPFELGGDRPGPFAHARPYASCRTGPLGDTRRGYACGRKRRAAVNAGRSAAVNGHYRLMLFELHHQGQRRGTIPRWRHLSGIAKGLPVEFDSPDGSVIIGKPSTSDRPPQLRAPPPAGKVIVEIADHQRCQHRPRAIELYPAIHPLPPAAEL